MHSPMTHIWHTSSAILCLGFVLVLCGFCSHPGFPLFLSVWFCSDLHHFCGCSVVVLDGVTCCYVTGSNPAASTMKANTPEWGFCFHRELVDSDLQPKVEMVSLHWASFASRSESRRLHHSNMPFKSLSTEKIAVFWDSVFSSNDTHWHAYES